VPDRAELGVVYDWDKGGAMKIGIISDIHDNVWNLHVALRALREVDTLICCGDLCSPFVIGLLANGLPDRPIHIVFGNNDGDLFRIAQVAAKWGQIQLHGEMFVGELGGKQVAVNHYPSIAATIDRGSFDLICYGHDHRFHIARHGKTLVVNPGTIMGYDPGAQGDVAATCAVYDTATGEIAAFVVSAATDNFTEHQFTIGAE
jgi:putative phosphoesterase